MSSDQSSEQPAEQTYPTDAWVFQHLRFPEDVPTIKKIRVVKETSREVYVEPGTDLRSRYRRTTNDSTVVMNVRSAKDAALKVIEEMDGFLEKLQHSRDTLEQFIKNNAS